MHKRATRASPARPTGKGNHHQNMAVVRHPSHPRSLSLPLSVFLFPLFPSSLCPCLLTIAHATHVHTHTHSHTRTTHRHTTHTHTQQPQTDSFCSHPHPLSLTHPFPCTRDILCFVSKSTLPIHSCVSIKKQNKEKKKKKKPWSDQ